MFNRRFRVKISVEITAVTCPGVWLCPYGRAELTFRTMGYYFKTNAVDARFPLLFHEKFHIEGFYHDGVESLGRLEMRLACERVDIALYQRGTRLAFFTGQLGTLLRCKENDHVPEIHSQILMRPTQSFPGIIAPKIEIVTRVQVHEDTPGIPPKVYFVVFSGGIHRVERPCDGGQRRQMPVCHTREQHEPRMRSTYPHRFIPMRACASSADRSKSDSDDEDSCAQ